MEGIGFSVHSAHTPMRANTCAHTWPGCCWCPSGTQGELDIGTKPVFSAAPLRPSWLKSATETVIVWFRLALQADAKPNQQILKLGIQTSQHGNYIKNYKFDNQDFINLLKNINCDHNSSPLTEIIILNYEVKTSPVHQRVLARQSTPKKIEDLEVSLNHPFCFWIVHLINYPFGVPPIYGNLHIIPQIKLDELASHVLKFFEHQNSNVCGWNKRGCPKMDGL